MLERILGAFVVLVVAGVVAWPWHNTRMTAKWIRHYSGFEGIEHIQVVQAGAVSWTGVLMGRLEPRQVEEFIRQNGLAPDPAAKDLSYMAGDHLFRPWVKEWPDSPDWYARRMPRPNDTCRLGCKSLCLVDRRSGWVLVAVEMPDFSGD